MGILSPLGGVVKKHRIYCNPADGKFNWEDKIKLGNLPGKLSKYGRVEVIFQKYEPKKSLKQLGYLHGGILPFLENETYHDYGLTAEEWYQFFKGKFGLRKYDTTGSIEIIRSIATYTEKELADLIQKIIVWCATEIHLTIPPANNIEDYI